LKQENEISLRDELIINKEEAARGLKWSTKALS